jgi:hypothetical protein
MSRSRLAHNRTPPAPNLSTAVSTAVHCSLNINGLNKSIKQSQLNTMRKIQGWKVLYLTDTRVYKVEEIPKIEKSLGVISGFWSLESPHYAGTAILFFMLVNILASYNDRKGHYTRVDYVWEASEYSNLAVYAPVVACDRQSFIATDMSDFLQSKPPLEKTIETLSLILLWIDGVQMFLMDKLVILNLKI